ncbi:MAG: autorepressor SdpR family transcription factor [Gemmatimonadota bacterium]|nr:autorepressor SdpR family transcription factor [Gemmatimonadota bacterium]
MTDAFRALADPTRRAILDLLRAGSRTSGEIAEQFGTSWPTISRHLSVLKDAGLINAEKEGQFIRYELATTVFQDVLEKLAAWTHPLPQKSGRHA